METNTVSPEPQFLAALIAAIAAIASAMYSRQSQLSVVRLSAQLEHERRQEERSAELEQIMARFSEGLGQAAYDLQSRLYNILKLNLIGTYVVSGDERSQSYVINNTVFLIAQYFAWAEIIRRDVQFVDLGESERTQNLTRLRDNIYSIWQSDQYGPLFRVFAGEQRAIGEHMIREGPRGLECIGYAEFLNRTDLQEDSLLNALRSDVLSLRNKLPNAQPRLVALHHTLINLLDFFDPDYVRFPQERRKKA